MLKNLIPFTAAAALLGCKPGSEPDQMMSKASLESVSAELVTMSFNDEAQLRRFLDGRGVEYEIFEEMNPEIIPNSKSCKIDMDKSFGFFWLRLKKSAGNKIFRYAVFKQDADHLCIESDFAFKNPYE